MNNRINTNKYTSSDYNEFNDLIVSEVKAKAETQKAKDMITQSKYGKSSFQDMLKAALNESLIDRLNYEGVLNKINLPKKYVNKDSYKFAVECVRGLFNPDEYEDDEAEIYFLEAYLSDVFPSWDKDMDMNELASDLYYGRLKWQNIDESWFE